MSFFAFNPPAGATPTDEAGEMMARVMADPLGGERRVDMFGITDEERASWEPHPAPHAPTAFRPWRAERSRWMSGPQTPRSRGENSRATGADRSGPPADRCSPDRPRSIRLRMRALLLAPAEGEEEKPVDLAQPPHPAETRPRAARASDGGPGVSSTWRRLARPCSALLGLILSRLAAARTHSTTPAGTPGVSEQGRDSPGTAVPGGSP